MKRLDGSKAKKSKTSNEELVSKLLEGEIEKQNTDRGDRIMATFNVKQVQDRQLVKVSVADLYSAPMNDEWNSYPKLTPDKQYELHQSIVDGGLMTPIIVWEIDKETVAELFEGNIDEYGFVGNKYMILAGHSRANAFVSLYNETKNQEYLYIDAIVRKKLTKPEAQYIIKITNYVNRELSAKQKRRDMLFMHRALSENKTKGMNIAKKIAEDSGSALRTVQYQIAISEKLIPPFVDMYDSGKLSQTNVLKLTRINENLQQWMYDTYSEQITNDVMRNFQKYFDRKELIETLFIEKEIEYTDITTKIPSHLEKKFRDMVKNWVKRNK